MGRPDLAIKAGLVVTPSTMPISLSFRISDTSAVSIKNFIDFPEKEALKPRVNWLQAEAFEDVE